MLMWLCEYKRIKNIKLFSEKVGAVMCSKCTNIYILSIKKGNWDI